MDEYSLVRFSSKQSESPAEIETATAIVRVRGSAILDRLKLGIVRVRVRDIMSTFETNNV